MKDSTSERPGLDRRTVLGGLAFGAVAATVGGSLAGCSTSSSSGGGGSASADKLAGVLPKYTKVEYVKPDLAGVNGSVDAYLSYPRTLTKTITEKPGNGGEITAMSPAYWPIPPGLGSNSYYAAVNDRLGTAVRFNAINGSDYSQKASALVAARDLPDWAVVPKWDQDPIARFSDAVPALFADLTDYLKGDEAAKYPFLANLPTRAWQFCTFDDRIYAIPFPNGILPGNGFYRKDLFDQLGLTPPADAAELEALCREATDAKSGRYALGDFFIEVQRMFGIPNKWRREGGTLVADIESPEFEEAVVFMRRLYDAGYVHPAIKAGQVQQSKDLFESGRTLMYWDGIGAWHEAVDRQRPNNPTFDMQAVPPFSHDGGTPVHLLQDPVGIMSFVNRKLSKDRVEQVLRVANFCAATFGTEEFHLLNYGIDGEHNTRNDSGTPVLTDKGRREITFTYSFLAGRPDFEADVQYPDFVRSRYEFEKQAAANLVKVPWDGIRVVEPPQYTGIRKPVDDQVNAIVRGHSPVSDFSNAVATWRRSGGDQLRGFYEKVLEDAGRN